MKQYRNDFPMLQRKVHGNPLVYLDSAATTLKPKSVIDVLNNYYQNECGTVHRAVYDLATYATQTYEQVRKKAQKFLKAHSSDEIIFTRGTTDAINVIALSLGKEMIKPNDEILISEMEHHSNIVPWQMLCESKKAVLKVIPITEKGELNLDEYKKLLSSRTKIVAIAHVANSTGTLNPIKEMIAWAHQKGALFFVDGAQSAPHMPIDLKDLDADFFACSGHKLYGPTGVGILYGKLGLLEQLPPAYGGSDMIDTVTFEKTTYNKPPLKFEPGTPPIASVIGLGAALDYIQTIGIEKIYAWEKDLLKYATDKLSSIDGIKIIGTAKEKGGILSFVARGTHALDLGTLLDLKGIAVRTGHLCAQPTLRSFNVPSVCRLSFGLYSTREDVDAFILHLNSTLKALQT